MGNKTNVLQNIYERVSRLTAYGVKEARIGSVDAARKHTDLPIIWVSLDSGREAPNFKNGASVDDMRVSISILDNKLKLTNNTLFRVATEGNGDTYTLSSEQDPAVQSDFIGWFNILKKREITTSTGVNGAYVITSGGGDGYTLETLAMGDESALGMSLIEFMSQLQYRPLTLDSTTINVLCNAGTLSGFTYAGATLGAPVNINFEGDMLALLQNIKRHTLTISDAYGNAFDSFSIYTYNFGASINGGTCKFGEEARGALIVLEKMLDALDVTSGGVNDITIGGVTNNRRDVEYTIDYSGDYVLVQVNINVESKIFLTGARLG